MPSHRTFRTSALLLLALGVSSLACKHGDAGQAGASEAGATADAATVVSSAPTAADAGADASASAKHDRVPPTFNAFFGKPASGPSFWLGLERRGDAVRALYRASSPTAFTGKMTDATHFSLRESHVAKGQKPTTIVGQLPSDSALVATLTDAKTGKKTQLASNGDVFDGASRDFKEEYTGSLGGRFIRMKLTKSGEKLTGIYRYAKSAQDIALEGVVTDKTGAFTMTEKVSGKATGVFEGVFVSKAGILAEWSSPDGARAFPVKMEEGSGYPDTEDLGHGMTLYPQEIMIEGKRCKSDIVFPQLRGAKDGAKQTALNALLRGNSDKQKTCEGPDEADIPDYEESSGYSLLTHKPGRFISISQGGYSYTGGAHGNGGSECFVIDTTALSRISLAESLTDAGRKTLGEKTTQALQKQLGVAKLTDSYFYNDSVEVTKTTNVCLSDTEISVEYNPYEVAPYVAGPQSASFPKADVRALFEKNEMTDALFAQ